ncbi:HSPB1-associated protein 1 homolog [Nothobranchius furzeri]|uniref:HSPB1 associated protein 1 n=1 Tax=Nothobranchius furzeri TaxID=105023 RepID=A0A1A7ZAK1_NOTFU|nr:HSPB1-associated protein 1 homolog [Nothobranchius furzeri]KAF7215352.1 HSPB1 associated protein 1 [Nothobranchius furzeri]
MAAVTSIKPFSPEETQRILHHLQQPAVFLKMTCDWPVLHWTAEHLSNCLNDTLVRFRLGRREETHAPLFETQCSYAEATVAQFLRWTQGQTDVGPFSDFSLSEHWIYADYKYIAALFQHQPSMFEDVKWSDFGFEGRNGKESTLWIGTEAANTPCHQDTYGFNLVLQVQGRKRWHLFPPEDTANLYPTRIPYEESSVFSQVDVLRPDLQRFPAFRRARAHVVTLQPGQVLFVPRHWWHYVESVDPITVSVNTWIELEVDNVARVTEAVTRTVVSAVKSSESDDNTDNWLNPTEEGVPSHRENMQYLNLAVRACAQRTRSLSPDLTEARPTKRDSRGQVKKHRDRADASEVFEVPLGPHLIPVSCQHDEWKKTVPEDSEINASQEDSAGGSEGSVGTNPTRPSQGKQSCGAGLPPRDCAEQEHDAPEDCAEENRSLRHTSITTNDLLDCLVHPDVISHITELLLERHIGGHL